MTTVESICVAITILTLVFAVLQYWKSRRLLKNLDQMLDAAIEGTFTEQNFDESRLSALENKLDRYLSASEVSSKNLAAEKNKIKQLIADISHQTKLPISNVLLYAQLLNEQELPEESRNCLAALQVQAEKLSFLITALVKLSRLETGILSLHPKANFLQPMLDDLELQYNSKAEDKKLNFIITPTDTQAVFDSKWTEEALGNLLDNAIKYTPAGGSVAVTITPYDLFCRVDVEDTGIGIPESEQAKIFGRFYRSPEVDTKEGLGLGLYLTREILSGEGGYLKVASEPGKGSRFSAFLPRNL